MNIENILKHYAIAAIWTSIDDDNEPLDNTFTIDNISLETMQLMRNDVAVFVATNKALLIESKLSEEMIGHNFWLTRNGHGAGFWCRGLGDIGNSLTTACKIYKAVDIYIMADGATLSVD
jgi:hypothetical protein